MIPNQFPTIDLHGRRLAFIDLCPSPDELKTNIGFSDKNHSMLKAVINQNNHSSMACFFGYLSNTHLVGGKIPYGSQEFQLSRANLRRDLATYKPNIIVIINQTLLSLAGKGEFKISEYRGSLFWCDDPSSPFFGYKCICTYPPRDIFIQYANLPFMSSDIARAIVESTDPSLDLPGRHYETILTPSETLQRINSIQSNTHIALDIEGGVNEGITCVSIATSSTHAFIIPFDLYEVEQTVPLILALRTKLMDPSIGVILQNGLYDTFALYWCLGILVRNISFDTMLSSWEITPEFPKSLASQASIWTREPFYKFQRKIHDKQTHYRYCCTDSCVTFEIAERHWSCFNEIQKTHFQFNLEMLYVLLYCEYRGIKYDVEASKTQLEIVRHNISELQTRINTRAGRAVNVDSPKQLSRLLYVDNALPAQHPKSKDGRGFDRTKTTTDINALLHLSITHPNPLLHEILAYRKLVKIAQSLTMDIDPDGRIRCSYNVVGTKTGRLSCSTSPTGNGGNLQTVTKKLRRLYTADEDHYFFQADLAGADGWTVAAHCAALGDPTMLEDYYAGIKPARVIGLMFQEGAEVSKLDRATLKSACAKIGEGDTEWLYFTSKRVQHGTNYLLGLGTMGDTILKDSYKLLGTPLSIDRKTCKRLQDLYLLRYKGVATWQNYVEVTVKRTGVLPSAAGHVHQFLGRKTDNKTYREACAFEPQINTTFATNLAILKMWRDPRNRRPDNSLIVEPLHQVHDAACGQFPKMNTDFAVPFIRECFQNEITIAGRKIIIPFEGGYGPDWLNLPHEI